MKSLKLFVLAAVIALGFQIQAAEPQFKRTEKIDKVWISNSFKFSEYEVLLVSPTEIGSEVKADGDKAKDRLELMKNSIQEEIRAKLAARSVGPKVTTLVAETEGKKSLKLVNTIIKFKKGSTATRLLVGMGTGLPYVRVRGEIFAEGNPSPLVIYEIDETASVMGAGYRGSKDLQEETSGDLSTDIAEFLDKISKGEEIRYTDKASRREKKR